MKLFYEESFIKNNSILKLKNMKKLYILLTCLLAIGTLSCGNKKESGDSESITMKPLETEVSGDLRDCFKVVDRSYKVTGDFERLITVELVREDGLLPYDEDLKIVSFSTIMSSPHVQVGFGIEFLDEDENVLDKVSANEGGMAGSYSPDEAVALVKLESGEKGTIRFIVTDEALEATSFRITSAYEEHEGSGSGNYTSNIDSDDSESDSDVDDDYSSSSGSTDWDELLDSYENYVDKYIAFLKKAKDGDASAMSEYPKLLKSAQEYSEKISKAKGDLSSSQLARYMKIEQKMLNAARDIK